MALVAMLAAPAHGEVAAKILSAQGTVEVQQSPWAPAIPNQLLDDGAAIRTGERSRAVLLLSDDTQLKVNAKSMLRLEGVRRSSNLLTRIAQQQGSGWSVLGLGRGQVWLRAKTAPMRLRVVTPAVTAAIRGTEFDLKVAEDGESVVSVLEGSVDFRNDQGFVLVNSGEQGRARPGQTPTKSVLLNPQDAVQWTLFYTASVSTRDHPFGARVAAAAAARLAAAAPDPVRKAQVYYDAGNLPAALGALEGLDSPAACETRGWILLAENRVPEAVAQFVKATAGSPRTRLGLSIAYFRIHQFAEAFDLVADPDGDARLGLQKATLQLLAGEVEEARALLESVPPGGPSYARVQGLLSNVYLAQNKKDAALEAARRAVAADPESPSAHLDMSFVRQSLFDLPAATRSVERALTLDADFLQAQVQYARLLFGAGDSGRAERVLRQALASAPEEAAAHSALGFVLLGRAETSGAQAAFERSLELDGTRGEPHLGLGIVAMRQGRRTDAVTEFVAAATLEPRLSVYQSYLGKAFYELRRFEQAFTALAAARDLDPRDPTPYLYAGVFENDLFLPGRAVQSFEESMRRNDDRAVYRSRFVLDGDRATRNVNLALAYSQLGLGEWANSHAVTSQLDDPTSSAAHLFLAATFLNLRGRTLSGGGELLLARLLVPANANAFNAFNDYTTLFELPRVDGSLDANFGSFATRGSSLTASGGTARYAWSVLGRYRESDGFRARNDDARDILTTDLFKVALSPRTELLLGYLHGQTREGDHGAVVGFVGDTNDPEDRRFSRLNRGEIGLHRQLGVGSDVVVYFAGQTSDALTHDADVFEIAGIPVEQRRLSRQPSLSLQAAHLLRVSKLRLRYGVDLYEGRSRIRRTNALVFPSEPPRGIEVEIDVRRRPEQYRTGFAHADYVASPRLTFSGGLNYDWANSRSFFAETDLRSAAAWNPFGGFHFRPTRASAVRFAATRVTQTHFQERVVPTHVYGFPFNQNEIPLSRATAYNFGYDQKVGRRSFVRATAFKRDRIVPVPAELLGRKGSIVEAEGNAYGAGLVWNQFLGENWTVVSDYRMRQEYDVLFGLRHENELDLATTYIHPRRFSLALRQSYFNQYGRLGEAARVGVWTTGLSISYEFPRKRAFVSFTVNNLTDRRFRFLVDPLSLDRPMPRRQLAGSLRVNL